MDSFVLAETFKYLYLLFAEEEDLVLDMDDFVFNTEAHLFPLSLATSIPPPILTGTEVSNHKLHSIATPPGQPMQVLIDSMTFESHLSCLNQRS